MATKKTKQTTKQRSARPMNVYLADADRRKVRELVSYLMLESGQRVSESQAIRAAINAAKSSKSLLDAFHPVSQTDLRYKR